MASRLSRSMNLVGPDKRGNMLRSFYGFIWLSAFGLQVSAALAQSPSSSTAIESCDKECQRRKVDALFKALDAAEISRRPKPSQSSECVAYDGRNLPDVLTDVCAKLKYVRSLPPGEASRFSCPGNSASLVGISAHRIVAMWGEPDFVPDRSPPGGNKGKRQWTYYLGSARPGAVGGGFAELTLTLVDGVVRKSSCELGQ